MNVSIIYKENVKSAVLDNLAKELPVIISGALEVSGGKLAILKPEQISLAFSPANVRDVGPDIRIMVFARSNYIREKTENARSKAIHEKAIELIAKHDCYYTTSVRLYLMKIGVAEHPTGN